MSDTRILAWTQDWVKTIPDLTVHVFDELASTNSHSKNLALSKRTQLVITNSQPQGRGRGENTWISPPKGSALLSSWVFDLDFHPQPILAPLVGLSVFNALEDIRGFSGTWLKPPNDIYIQDKKIAGILIELQSQGHATRCIIGLGLNIFNHPHLKQSGCLSDFRSQNIDMCAWQGFLNKFFTELQRSIVLAQNEKLTQDMRNKLLKAINGLHHNTYDDVLEDGSLKKGSTIIPWSSL